MLIGGHEARLKGDSVVFHSYWKKPGLAINVGKRPPRQPLVVYIRPVLTLAWPDPKLYKNQTDIRHGTIKWRPYPQARDYIVTIRQLNRIGDGRISSYRIINQHVHKRTELPLARLPHVRESDAETEYTVEVLAFAANGRLLGKSLPTLERGSFVLTDSAVLVEQSLARKAKKPGDLKILKRDQRLYRAAELLIRERLLPLAEATLMRISGIGMPGKKEALLGLVKAMQGQCVAAKRYYLSARTKGGGKVLPAARRKYCRQKIRKKAATRSKRKIRR